MYSIRMFELRNGSKNGGQDSDGGATTTTKSKGVYPTTKQRNKRPITPLKPLPGTSTRPRRTRGT